MEKDTATSRDPVTKVLAGYSNSEFQTMIDNFRYETMMVGGDVSLFANTRLASFLHTTIVSPRKAYAPLPDEPNPEVGQIEAEAAYGKLSLDDFVTSPKSFICVNNIVQ